MFYLSFVERKEIQKKPNTSVKYKIDTKIQITHTYTSIQDLQGKELSQCELLFTLSAVVESVLLSF